VHYPTHTTFDQTHAQRLARLAPTGDLLITILRILHDKTSNAWAHPVDIASPSGARPSAGMHGVRGAHESLLEEAHGASHSTPYKSMLIDVLSPLMHHLRPSAASGEAWYLLLDWLELCRALYSSSLTRSTIDRPSDAYPAVHFSMWRRDTARHSPILITSPSDRGCSSTLLISATVPLLVHITADHQHQVLVRSPPELSPERTAGLRHDGTLRQLRTGMLPWRWTVYEASHRTDGCPRLWKCGLLVIPQGRVCRSMMGCYVGMTRVGTALWKERV